MAGRIGGRVRAERQRQGLSQARLVRTIADLGSPYTSMGRNNLARLEHGGHLPSLRTLVSVARGLGVSVASLLDGA